MSSENFKTVFSKNLQYFLKQKKVSQSKFVEDLELPYTTVTSWITGERMPRMNKVQLLADYFGVEKSALLEDWQDPKKAMQQYATKWNSLSPQERTAVNANLENRLDLEQQSRILVSILNIAEIAGVNYFDYFIDNQIVDYNRCEKMFNVLMEELKLFIDFADDKK